jgi:deoxyribodipyrimidine photo-lyase
LRRDPDPGGTAGPEQIETIAAPEAVWITAESLGDDDPALSAHPDLPAVFVFDRALLDGLALSSKRLVFLVDRLAELGAERHLEVHLGDPVSVLRGRPLAATFTPVPGWRHRAGSLELAAVHPWPWLHRPGPGPLTSFSAWARSR